MQYLILGTTEAHDAHGTAIPLGGPRLRALLTALALRPGRPVAVHELVDDIWGTDPADPPADAPAALQALVGRLRRAIGKDRVTMTPGGYRLTAAPADVDLYEFERLAREGADELTAGRPDSAARTLRTALALWRGPALADLPEARDQAVRPEARRTAAVRHRIEADLARGAVHGLVPELHELVAAHPYDEPFHAQRIRALRAEHRTADALAAYEHARRTLADALGTDPGPELKELHRQLLAPEPEPGPRPAGHAPGRPRAEGPTPMRPPPSRATSAPVSRASSAASPRSPPSAPPSPPPASSPSPGPADRGRRGWPRSPPPPPTTRSPGSPNSPRSTTRPPCPPPCSPR